MKMFILSKSVLTKKTCKRTCKKKFQRRSRLEAEVAIEKGILTREGGDNGRWIISAELTEKL